MTEKRKQTVIKSFPQSFCSVREIIFLGVYYNPIRSLIFALSQYKLIVCFFLDYNIFVPMFSNNN